jgi:hypothetical protein
VPGLVRLHEHAAGLLAAPGRPVTCAICWKVRSAARRSPRGQAEIGIDHADQRHAGK